MQNPTTLPRSAERDAPPNMFDSGAAGPPDPPGHSRGEIKAEIRRIMDELAAQNPQFSIPSGMSPLRKTAISDFIRARPLTAIWQFTVIGGRCRILVIAKDEIFQVALDGVSESKLASLCFFWIMTYKKGTDWQEARDIWNADMNAEALSLSGGVWGYTAALMRRELLKEPTTQASNELWLAMLHELTKVLGDIVVQPIWNAMVSRGLDKNIKELLICPHRFFHLFPFHACTLPGGRILGDIFEISYTPSLTLALRARSLAVSAVNGGLPRALITSNQGQDLSFAKMEAEAVCMLHAESRELDGCRMTRTDIANELREVDIWAHCSHGTFNHQVPLQSGIFLGHTLLTSKDIVTGIRMEKSPLVCLNACETGFLTPGDSDESLSLAVAFLVAGARCVVSSLWQVNDLAAALWSIRFHRHVAEGRNPSLSAQLASRWLRGDPTAQDSLVDSEALRACLQHLCKSQERGSWQFDVGAVIAELTSTRDPAQPPFSHLYYWAPYAVHGWGLTA